MAFSKEATHLFNIDASAEILNFSGDYQRYSSGVALSLQNKNGYNFGLTAVSLADPSGMSEAGFHIQKTLFKYGDVTISSGVHDILYKRDGNDVIRINDMSFFTVFTSYKEFDNYNLVINFGGGTGKIDYDPQTEYAAEGQTAGVFMGFKLNTSYFKKSGGMDVIMEYDGKGAHMGFRIPITNDYLINIGITNLLNLGKFGTESKEGKERLELQADAPSVSVGFTMNVPNLFADKSPQLSDEPYDDGIPLSAIGDTEERDTAALMVMLRDSIRIAGSELKNVSDHNLLLKQKLAILMDSTRVFHLEKQIERSNLNKIMRHVSRSLRHFYAADYRQALAEIDIAIKINPNVALSYARRGSIYYKLGDFQRATMNWNIALKLDPEFTEIQELLKASKDNRLSAVEMEN